jgi:hypothetical protein
MKNPAVMLRVSPASLYPSPGTMDGKFLDPSEESNPWNEAAFLPTITRRRALDRRRAAGDRNPSGGVVEWGSELQARP